MSGEDMAERLSLIEGTCRDLIARIDRREYNYSPEHVRADLSYLLACADPRGSDLSPTPPAEEAER